ncbi:TetR family transcriptional regulator [Herbiconiux moechotypicola]|uniref:HTH tetR-type domain-containing protein n=1 Tax=Herbiconiux moechotypicola TaxID=637393 RepID=A0ABN3E249_9MICO|nr:TetR family transcriptional regulator [Herbiconiux moechotypicola]MCS5731343.1 TetR family transcriptional regulator [Herbiconiux moechotypicola]
METSKVTPSGGVRERMRDAIRAELMTAALASIREVGFANTTAAAIAATVGVSERTFFRYFPTKEDAVLQRVEAMGPAIAAALGRRPSAETAFEALRGAFDVAVAAVAEDPTTIAVIMSVNRAEPALRRRHLQQQDEWITRLRSALLERSPDRGDSLLAGMQCALMLQAWEKALLSCFEKDDFAVIGAELDLALEQMRTFLGR